MNWQETLIFPLEVPISEKAKDLILRQDTLLFHFLSNLFCMLVLGVLCVQNKVSVMVITLYTRVETKTTIAVLILNSFKNFFYALNGTHICASADKKYIWYVFM